MIKKPLSQTNPNLKDSKIASRNRLRSLASSTAIETGEEISAIEAKIERLLETKARTTLA